MKKSLAAILMTLFVLTSCSHQTPNETVDALPASASALQVQAIDGLTDEVLGTWIASVYNINFPSRPDLTVNELKNEIDSIVSNAKALGLNTIFFQAHPSADALYKSSLFPVSKFLSTSGELYFDPLEYIIAKCHENGIKLHVWINPLRVTTSNADSKEDALMSLDKSIGAGTTPELLVHYADGKLYYNAGMPEVRDLITACVAEILTNYDADGIVFDDYFYPYPVDNADFDDGEAFAKYGNGASLDDWRRNNINALVKNVYDKVKEINEDCLFGVAPFGIWQNANGENGGSATKGLEGYNSLYCDALTWAKDGYVDYLSPQLYWDMESESASYKTLCEWWNSKLDSTGCAFIPSLAPYRYDNDWDDPKGEMTDQISLGREMVTYRGVMFYGYAALKDNVNNVGSEIKESSSSKHSYYTIENHTIGLKILSHKDGFVTTERSITIQGTSAPEQPLTLNGKIVSRKIGGEFELEVTLSTGENNFELKNGDKIERLTVYRKETN